MDNVTTIGLDIAKSVFQVHGVDATSIATITGARQYGGAACLPMLRQRDNANADDRTASRLAGGDWT